MFILASGTMERRLLGPLPAIGRGQFYPPSGGASRAPGLPRAAADTISGRKPGPTLSAEKENAVVPCAPRRSIPLCCPYVALCEEIGRRVAHVPTNQDAAAVEPLQTKGETKKLMPKEPLYFPFQCRIFTF